MSVAQTNNYVYGDCTYGMAVIHPDLPGNLGNATDWPSNARARGLKVLASPVVNTVVSYRAGSHYTIYGHVANVQAVNLDGTFTVREMNYRAWNEWDDRTSTMDDVQGFIVPPSISSSVNDIQLLSQQSNCHTFTWSVFGSTLCFDGMIGGFAIAAGAIIGVAGLVILVIFTLQKTSGGKAAVESANAVGTAGEKTTQPIRDVQTQKREADAASAKRVATARARAAMRQQQRSPTPQRQTPRRKSA